MDTTRVVESLNPSAVSDTLMPKVSFVSDGFTQWVNTLGSFAYAIVACSRATEETFLMSARNATRRLEFPVDS